MIRLAAGLAATLLLSTVLATAQTAPAAPTAAPEATAPTAAEHPGRALFRTKTCIACHGRDGGKAIQVFPDLAGQDLKYLIAQMGDITSGARVSGNDARGYPRTQGMKDIMHLVTEEERATIADFLSKQPAPKPRVLDPAPDAARLAAGKEAYAKGGCTTCHGPDGNKPLPSYPWLGAMKRDYLVLQMTEIRDGIRQNGRVKSMVPFAKKLDDAKIAAIADYLSQIERASK